MVRLGLERRSLILCANTLPLSDRGTLFLIFLALCLHVFIELFVMSSYFLAGLSMLGCWLGLSVICCLVQFKVTAKDLEQGGYVCPFNFQACICGCCQGKDGKESSSKEEETVYLFTNGDKYDLREGRKR